MRIPFSWLAKLLVTAVIIAVIVWKIDLATVVSTLLTGSLAAVFGGLLLTLVQAALAAKRLVLIVSLFGRLMAFGDGLRVTLESMFFSQTFVSFLGGDAQRIWRLRKCGFSMSDSISAIALDRVIGLMVNHVLVLLALPYLLFAVASNGLRLSLVAIAGGGLAMIVLVLGMGIMHEKIEAWLPNWLRTNRLLRLLSEVSTVGRHLFTRDERIMTTLLITFIMSAINCVMFFLILRGWNIGLSAAFGCALVVPAVLEIAMLPVSIAGWGVREGAAIFAFAAFGVSANIAFGSSVTFALIILAVGLLGGLVWLFDQRPIGAPAIALIEPAAETHDRK
jgi:glycosyltransferase 2 family protein